MRKRVIPLGASLILLVLIATFAVSVPEVAAQWESCRTSKSTYRVGAWVIMYFTLGSDDYDYQVIRPDGSVYGPVYLGSGPGRTSDSAQAGYPTGLRTVELLDSSGSVVATCYFTVTGSGGTYTLTVTAKDSLSRRPISGADVYMDGNYMGSTNRQGKLTIRNVSAGTHNLEIYDWNNLNCNPGYWSNTITVSGNTPVTAYVGCMLVNH